MSTWTLAGDGSFKPFENFTFTLPQPGPVAASQSASRPHQAVIEPSGHHMLVPDLGADLIRIFGIDNTTNALRELQLLQLKPGSDPRHAVFWTHANNGTYHRLHRRHVPSVNKHVYLYVVTEITNSIIGYSVTHQSNGTLQFNELFTTTTFGGAAPPPGAAAAEILVTVRLYTSISADSQADLLPGRQPARRFKPP